MTRGEISRRTRIQISTRKLEMNSKIHVIALLSIPRQVISLQKYTTIVKTILRDGKISKYHHIRFAVLLDSL
jgi:hypothetical protein